MVVFRKQLRPGIDLQIVNIPQKIVIYLLCGDKPASRFDFVDNTTLSDLSGRRKRLYIKLIHDILSGDIARQIPPERVYKRTDNIVAEHAMKHHVKICPCYVISGFIAFQHIAFVIENVSAVSGNSFGDDRGFERQLINCVVKKSEIYGKRIAGQHKYVGCKCRELLGTLLCLFIFLIRKITSFVNSISFPVVPIGYFIACLR